jgi:serine protease Do
MQEGIWMMVKGGTLAALVGLVASSALPATADVRFRPAPTRKPQARVAVATGGLAPSALPAEALRRTKAATVFIRAETRKDEVQGTGFFALQRGLVLTNAHVATPENSVAGKLRVILNSGTRAERSLPAEVLAADMEMDLAVLRVSGQNLPEPLPLSGAAMLLETTPLYLFGFPFGDGLAAHGCNPEPSVLRASVSCLRHTAEGGLDVIQLDGELHPGNSGGPVVDALGRVVGITVSRLRATRIGFAIPGERVITLLEKQSRSLRDGSGRNSSRGANTGGARQRLEGQVRSRRAR